MVALPSAIRQWLLPILEPAQYLEGLLAAEGAPEPLETDANQLLQRLQWQLAQRLKVIDPGTRTSMLKGQGLDFANLREYVPGDDIRKIDWNVFARTFTPHIREYHDEKQMTVWLAIDLTPSMQFGHRTLKAHHAIEVAALLGALASNAGFKVGMMAFDSKNREIIRPKAGTTHMQKTMQMVLDQQETAKQYLFTARSNPGIFVDHAHELSRLVQKSSFVFLISDFLSVEEGWEQFLGNLARTSLLTSIILQDPTEQALPEGGGLVDVFDPETGDVIAMDCDDPFIIDSYSEWFEKHTEQLTQTLTLTGDVVTTTPLESPADVIIRIFQSRGIRS